MTIAHQQKEPTRRLLTGAVGFLEAARTVHKHGVMDHWPAINQLLGLAIELVFKAYVVSRGGTDADCRGIGHDLYRGKDAAEKLGLQPLPDGVAELLERLNPPYKSHELRYLNGDWVELIEEDQAIALVDALVMHVGYSIPVSDL